MPIKIKETLPAKAILEQENIFVMTESRAASQDIRPLRLLILNLMPTKIVTETQLLRCLSNSPLQIEINLLKTSSYTSKNTPEEHLLSHYTTFDEICSERFDGLIITGAPVENMEFEEVTYWNELCEIMDWSKTNVYSTFNICWGAQAALYRHYDIPKYPLKQKLFGVFEHTLTDDAAPLIRGFDETFRAPHSRHTEVLLEDVARHKDLKPLAVSEEAGLYLAMSKDGRQIFVTGHAEYDAETLALEYKRDLERGIDVGMPVNYFPGNNPLKPPKKTWRSHGYLLFSNWLNYYVYQRTPYDLKKLNIIKEKD